MHDSWDPNIEYLQDQVLQLIEAIFKWNFFTDYRNKNKYFYYSWNMATYLFSFIFVYKSIQDYFFKITCYFYKITLNLKQKRILSLHSQYSLLFIIYF